MNVIPCPVPPAGRSTQHIVIISNLHGQSMTTNFGFDEEFWLHCPLLSRPAAAWHHSTHEKHCCCSFCFSQLCTNKMLFLLRILLFLQSQRRLQLRVQRVIYLNTPLLILGPQFPVKWQWVISRAGLRYCGALSTWQSRCPPPNNCPLHQHHSLYSVHYTIYVHQ